MCEDVAGCIWEQTDDKDSQYNPDMASGYAGLQKGHIETLMTTWGEQHD